MRGLWKEALFCALLAIGIITSGVIAFSGSGPGGQNRGGGLEVRYAPSDQTVEIRWRDVRQTS